MQAPIGKSFKTQGLADHGAVISSRIREVRENLGGALQPVVFELSGAMRSGARSAGFPGVVDPGMSGD